MVRAGVRPDISERAHYECLDDNQLMEFKPDGRRLIKELADDNAQR
jgi:hypothetical protein